MQTNKVAKIRVFAASMLIILVSAALSAQTTLFYESFGSSGYYSGPANGYDGMDNPSEMYTADEIIVQNYNPSAYEDASAQSHIFVSVDRQVFTIRALNTSEYTGCRLSFGTASWWGIPANFMKIQYSTDGETWDDVDNQDLADGEYTNSPGGSAPWSWVLLNQQLPSATSLQIRFTSINSEQGFFLDDIRITGVSPDTEPPATPTGLTAGMVEPTSFLLEWNPSADDQGVSHYLILQDGKVISQSSSTSALIRYLSPGTTASYSVIAHDLAGNASPASEPVEVILPPHPEGHKYSWQKAQAQVLAEGGLEWDPEPFSFQAGPSVRYIDYEAGNDTSDGTGPETAWKHHPWDAAASGKAAASTGIHTYVFKRGVAYRGRLTARESGSFSNPVRLTSSPSWGTGEAAIYGSVRITGGWIRADAGTAPDVPDPGKVWYQDLPGLNNTKNVCEVDGEQVRRIRLARTPNYRHHPAEPMKDWWFFTGKEKVAGNLKLTDTEHLVHEHPDAYAGGDVWATEDVIVMCTLWKQKILSYDPETGTITVDNQNFGGIDCPYYIENTPFLLDTASEYYYDNSAGRMYLRLEGDRDPNTTAIEIASRSNLLEISSKQHIEVSGLTFGFTTRNQVRYGTGDGVPAIHLRGACSNITIKNCRFTRLNGAVLATGNANAASPVSDILVADNELEYMDDFGILMNESGGIYLEDISILRNRIHENGSRHLGRWYSSIPAIQCYLVSGEVAGNIIEYTWGNGINVFWGKGSGSSLEIPFIRGFVHHNRVSHSLMGVNDYGGIECWQGGPAYYYNNISYDAQGFKYNWNMSLGYNFYFDGSFKTAAFNNIAHGHGLSRSHGAYMQVLGYYNIYANNLAYNMNAMTRSGNHDLSPDGQNIYLANIADSCGNTFVQNTKPSGMPFESYAGNVFSGREFWGKVVMGTEIKQFDAFIEEVRSYRPDVGQVGYVASKRVLKNPAAGDFRLHEASEAVDRGVRYFLPFPLSRVVGEWHFYRHTPDSSLVKADNFYFTSDFNNRITYNDVPKNHMQAYGLSDSSFVYGALEDWTAGALRFDGDSTWCLLEHSRASAHRSNDVDMKTNDFILEVYLKADSGHTGGVILSKWDLSGYGYELGLDDSGRSCFSLMNSGSPAWSLSGSVALNDGAWHHLLVEVNRTAGCRMYVDGQPAEGEEAGSYPPGEVSLSNEADLMVGTNNEGAFFAGCIDFLRISKAGLRQARTTIDELYSWEFDGPFLYDFAGNPPVDRRDAGPIEFGRKLCEMSVDPSSLSFGEQGGTLTAAVSAAEGYELVGHRGDFFNYQSDNQDVTVDTEAFREYGQRQGYINVYGCNETRRLKVVQDGVACQFETALPDTVVFGYEGGQQDFQLSTNADVEIQASGDQVVTANHDQAGSLLKLSAGINNSYEEKETVLTLTGCAGRVSAVIRQQASTVSATGLSSHRFHIWPNPLSGGRMNVLIPEEAGVCRLTVTDVAGSVVYRQDHYPGTSTLDLPLKKGTYLMCVTGVLGPQTIKIIVL